MQTVDDLKSIKLYTSAGNDRMVQWFKANGFQPRAMAMTDIMTGLSTGMIDGMPSTPLAAMLFQWNRQTPYMLDIGLAPIVGATVITQKAWKAIPDADQAEAARAAADGVEKRLRVEVPKLDENAVAMMTKNGLTVTKATGPEWKTQLDNLAKTMRGEMVPPDIFDLAIKARDEFRKQQPPKEVQSAVVKAASPAVDARPAARVYRGAGADRRRHRVAGAAGHGGAAARRDRVAAGVRPRHSRLGSHRPAPHAVGRLPRRGDRRARRQAARARHRHVHSGGAAARGRHSGGGVRRGSAVVLAWGGWQMAMIEREAGTEIGAGIQAWVAQLVLPIAFALIAMRIVWRPGYPYQLNGGTTPEQLRAAKVILWKGHSAPCTSAFFPSMWRMFAPNIPAFR